MIENTLPQCCPVLAVACLLVQSQLIYQDAFLNGDDAFWEHRLLLKGVSKSEPVQYDSLHREVGEMTIKKSSRPKIESQVEELGGW